MDAARRARRLAAGAALLLLVLAIARVVSTYRVFSQTVDEPLHVAAGYQWLTTDHYDLDLEHPPLARIALAAPFPLRGIHLPADGDRLTLGNDLLMSGGRYRVNLALARLGTLPWFLLAIAVTGAWSLRLFGRAAALLTIAFVSSLPPLLGHAGLATTDMAAAATVVLALFCYLSWLRNPTWRNAFFLGLA
ncbi:MAG: glycosyl transferase, partial [Thermoanaerobaculia bacterium]